LLKHLVIGEEKLLECPCRRHHQSEIVNELKLKFKRMTLIDLQRE
jgi:hypothetical protein